MNSIRARPLIPLEVLLVLFYYMRPPPPPSPFSIPLAQIIVKAGIGPFFLCID
jgi:hypothetical protein